MARSEADYTSKDIQVLEGLLADVPEAAGARATALLRQRICEAIVAWADEVTASLPEVDHESRETTFPRNACPTNASTGSRP